MTSYIINTRDDLLSAMQEIAEIVYPDLRIGTLQWFEVNAAGRAALTAWVDQYVDDEYSGFRVADDMIADFDGCATDEDPTVEMWASVTFDGVARVYRFSPEHLDIVETECK